MRRIKLNYSDYLRGRKMGYTRDQWNKQVFLLKKSKKKLDHTQTETPQGFYWDRWLGTEEEVLFEGMFLPLLYSVRA